MAGRSPPLHAVHEAAGARFTEFGGWEMPVQFAGIRAEHRAVRTDAGIFDVSHMGEVEVAGPDAAALMGRLTTNDVTRLDAGDAQYTMVTNEDGHVVDDTLVYRLPASDEGEYLFVPNAGHDEGLVAWWRDHRDDWGLDVTVRNLTADRGMVAVQGPNAPALVEDAVSGESTNGGLGTAADVAALDGFEATYARVAGVRCWVSRTGYTGEDGFELVFPADESEAVWSAFDCQPCGLGARDTLRIEMGFLLSGQDFDPETEPRTPYEAGVGFTVKLDHEFVGRDALERQSAEGVEETFVGVHLLDRGVPRHGYEITAPDGTPVGHLTSGTMSPTLDEPIGLGYVDAAYAADHSAVRVVIRDDPKRAELTTPPFIES